jgi:hypothetical protein
MFFKVRLKPSIYRILIVVLAMGPVALYQATPAQAAALTSRKDTLSTSAPATNADHTIQFVTPTGAGDSTDTIKLEFDTLGTTDQFNLTGIVEDDVDLEVDDDGACDGPFTDRVTAGTAAADAWGVTVTVGADEILFTHPTNNGSTEGVSAGRCVQIKVGTNATGSGTGANQIDNPAKTAAAGTADINDVYVSGTFGDTGSMLVATIEGVTVSVSVAESMTFTMAGVTAGSCTGDTGSPSVIDTSGSATSVPFGTVSTTNAFFAACQLLTVSTNAQSGYALTSEENTSLKYGSNTIADSTCDAACSESTGAAWATATNNGFAHYCENVSGSACAAAGTSNYRQFACRGADADCNPGTGSETIQNLMTANAPADSNQAKVHYKLSISPVQAAGSYSNTVTYIATPTF